MSVMPEFFRDSVFNVVTSGVTMLTTTLGVMSPFATVSGTVFTVANLALDVIDIIKNRIPHRRHLHVEAAFFGSVVFIVSVVKMVKDIRSITSVEEVFYYVSEDGVGLGVVVFLASLFSRAFYLLGSGDLLKKDADLEATEACLEVHNKDAKYLAAQDRLLLLKHRFLFLFTKLKMAVKCHKEIEKELEQVVSELEEVEGELAALYSEYEDVLSLFAGEGLEELIFIKFLFAKYFLEYLEKQLDLLIKRRDVTLLDSSLSHKEKKQLLDEVIKQIDAVRKKLKSFSVEYKDFFARICDKYGLPKKDLSDLETRREVLQASLDFLNARLQGTLDGMSGEWFSIVSGLLYSEIQDI